MALADINSDASTVADRTAVKKVFLSYSRKDEEKIVVLQAALEAADGFDVLRDKEDIFPAEDWRARLESLILAADAFVLCMTPHSLGSEVVTYAARHSNRSRIGSPRNRAEPGPL